MLEKTGDFKEHFGAREAIFNCFQELDLNILGLIDALWIESPFTKKIQETMLPRYKLDLNILGLIDALWIGSPFTKKIQETMLPKYSSEEEGLRNFREEGQHWVWALGSSSTLYRVRLSDRLTCLCTHINRNSWTVRPHSFLFSEMNWFGVACSFALFAVALSCKSWSGYQCVTELTNTRTDYAIYDDNAPIRVSMMDAACGKKTMCFCVKATQLFVTEFDPLCYPYASVCFNYHSHRPSSNYKFTLYMDLPLSFNKSDPVRVLELRKVGASAIHETLWEPWERFDGKIVDLNKKSAFLVATLGPLVTTHGYVNGQREPKTIITMWQPKGTDPRQPNEKIPLCERKIKVTNLVKGPFHVKPTI
uniref:Neur_chan_LBD domain-containing protein n=1 Tax=Steinernema glaseri TaxID=37863 RepID=A0A1I7ZCB7_9BILA